MKLLIVAPPTNVQASTISSVNLFNSLIDIIPEHCKMKKSETTTKTKQLFSAIPTREQHVAEWTTKHVRYNPLPMYSEL